jgi:hypothetical protein
VQGRRNEVLDWAVPPVTDAFFVENRQDMIKTVGVEDSALSCHMIECRDWNTPNALP